MNRPSYKQKWQVERAAKHISLAINVIFAILIIVASSSHKSKVNQLINQVNAQESKEASIAATISGFGGLIRNVEIEVPRNTNCKTETCQMISYIAEKFEDDADEMIAIIRTCENGLFTSDRVSPLNIQQSGRRSYDVGLAQINVEETNTEEIEKLKDWKYNIDRAYQKYEGRGNKFTDWTCSTVIGQKNYLSK